MFLKKIFFQNVGSQLCFIFFSYLLKFLFTHYHFKCSIICMFVCWRGNSSKTCAPSCVAWLKKDVRFPTFCVFWKLLSLLLLKKKNPFLLIGPMMLLCLKPILTPKSEVTSQKACKPTVSRSKQKHRRPLSPLCTPVWAYHNQPHMQNKADVPLKNQYNCTCLTSSPLHYGTHQEKVDQWPSF